MNIALFLNNLDEEYQISVYRGVQMEIEALDMGMICVQDEMFTANKAAIFSSKAFIGADGILILSSVFMHKENFVTNFAEFFKNPQNKFNCPVVSIGQQLPYFPSIIVESHDSMYKIMKHLIDFHKYRKFLFVGGPKTHQDNITRETIYKLMIETTGCEGTVINGEFTAVSGSSIMRDYLISHVDIPDAVVAASDTIAFGVQRALHTYGKICAVIGFDDTAKAQMEISNLTTVRQPFEDMGRQAVRTLRDMIMGEEVPKVVSIDSTLVIRASCGCGKRIEETKSLMPRLLEMQYNAINSESFLLNVSFLSQSLITVNSLEEIALPLQYFLTGLNIATFYLILYKKPGLAPMRQGILVFQRVNNKDSFDFSYLSQVKEQSLASTENIVFLNDFFGVIVKARDTQGGKIAFGGWAIYHLRSGSEYLGLIVYSTTNMLHSYVCSAAVFIANTVKRLQIAETEQERLKKLEEEVAFRTRDLVATHKKLEEEAKRRLEVEAEVLSISELERQRFSMDLHDDICQRLAGISMFCRSLASREDAEILLPELSEMIDETLTRTRQYAHDSFPVELDAFGLNEALFSLCHSVNKQSLCLCSYKGVALAPLPLTHVQKLNIYRIIQEALANVIKHSKAKNVSVGVDTEEGYIVVYVQDDGIGDVRISSSRDGAPASSVQPRRRGGGLGLRSMQYRAHQLGADYRIVSSETGTLVEVKIPISIAPPAKPD
ncbi:MAG: substrate-binding domain-containing protein [Treponema sp.]|jgi:signal transduction histidine kinase/DNA-binding LacI/PurR family transcriptional regulator|nr:substrate-binding domain-containing protein [Treponema sp.]